MTSPQMPPFSESLRFPESLLDSDPAASYEPVGLGSPIRTLSLARCCQWLNEARLATTDHALWRLIDDVTDDVWMMASHLGELADDVVQVVLDALASVATALDFAR